mgnify:CR=1 FL=1
MKVEEGWTESADGNRLFWRRHTPEGEARAVLLFVHGLAEHSGRYLHVLDHFAEGGFDCPVSNWRRCCSIRRKPSRTSWPTC